jgi:hypothetical protein
MTVSIIHTDFIRKHLAHAVLTVLGLSGVVLVFLPFTHDVAPILVVPPPLPPFRGFLNFGDIFWFATPFVLLPFAISAGYLRWSLTGRLSRGEARVGYALALMAAAAVVLVELVDWLDEITCRESDGWCMDSSSMFKLGVLVIYPLAAFAAGAGFVIKNIRDSTQSLPNALVAMQVVYVPLALFLILVGFDDPQIGWYLAIVTVLVYGAQIVMAAKRPLYSLIFYIPLGLAWSGVVFIN